MANNIVHLERAERGKKPRLFFVDWNLGNKCHYACSYCPEHLHDGSWLGAPLEKCLDFVTWVNRIAANNQLRPHFHFSGGEPTLYRNFTKLVRTIVENDLGSISMVSNGARPASWWEKNAGYFAVITLSYHIENAYFERFAKVAGVCARDTNLHINVPAHIDHFDECQSVLTKLLEANPSASGVLKPILPDFREPMIPYSQEQMEILKTQFRPPVRSEKQKEREELPLIATYESGEKLQQSAAKILARGENGFKGYECWAGLESMAVMMGGAIFRAVCRVNGPLGHINEPLPEPPSAPITCPKDQCTCLTDIKIRKYVRQQAAAE